MRYDRFDMTLHATVDELMQLVEHQVGDRPAPAHWDDAGVTIAGTVHPAVAQITRIATLPRRVTAIERFDVEPAATVHVGWDERGRAVLTTITGDAVVITATRLELLPALLAQMLRLGPPVSPTERELVMTTAGAIDAAIASIADRDRSDGALDALGMLGSFVGAWRVTGGWSGRPVDRTLTVLDAGPRGLWSVEVLSDAPHPSDASEVVLRPIGHHDAIALVGDVVTGRPSCRRRMR
jgi:hypothetical protein